VRKIKRRAARGESSMDHKPQAMRIAESDHRQAMASGGDSYLNAEDMVEKLATELGEALDLLKSAHPVDADGDAPAELQPALLEQCLEICSAGELPVREPVRTIHHFACTGGTLFSKCIAALPNVQLLSEVDPLSPLGLPAGGPRFVPTDAVSQLRQATRGFRPEALVDLFSSQLRVIYNEADSDGQYLVIRDHTHSHFCTASEIADRPTVRELVAAVAPVRSIVTVRHPVDSYVSLKAMKWIHFHPGTFEEYCQRYIEFLSRYAETPVVRYEDLVDRPAETMTVVADLLALPFDESFMSLQSVFRLTGDSGRRDGPIGPRERRAEAVELHRDSGGIESYRALLGMLGYD
jgi:hypothetical protein